MTPTELQTDETLRFVLENIGSKPSRILEVGCGDGWLAKRLVDLGHDVVAVDSSEEAIARACRLGVAARVARFPDFHEEPFDVVLFTRSLHHIRPLTPAVTHARQLVKPKGLLVVEDFAYSDTREYAARWFYRLLSLLSSCDVLLPAEDTFGRKLLNGHGEFSLWLDHGHEINTADEVREAIGQHFALKSMQVAPYLYRYVSRMVAEDDQGGRIVSAVLELERETGANIEQFLIGRRFVAQMFDTL